MNLDNLKYRYLVTALYFDNDSDMLQDKTDNTYWLSDYIYKNLSSGEGSDNITLSNIYEDQYRSTCLEIPSPNGSIINIKDIILGNESFTIDFWMNLILCNNSLSEMNALENSTKRYVNFYWSEDQYIKIYDKGIVIKLLKDTSAYLLYGYFRNSNSGYLSNKAYQIISSNTNKLIHVLISYNYKIANNVYENKIDSLKIYLNGINIVDITKYYKYLYFNRRTLLINIVNENSFTPLYISNFRVWDGVSLEIDENKEIYTSDNEYYKDLIFSYTDFVNLYHDVTRNNYKR